MSYLPAVSRRIGDISQSFEYAGVDENGETVTEVWDNEIIGPFRAKGIEIYNDKKTGYLETSLSDIDLEVYVTSSRVIIRCDKYDKGSRHWRGGLSALALNAVERGIGKARSKGNVSIYHNFHFVLPSWREVVIHSVISSSLKKPAFAASPFIWVWSLVKAYI